MKREIVTCDYCGKEIGGKRSNLVIEADDPKYSGGHIRVTLETICPHCPPPDICKQCAEEFLRKIVEPLFADKKAGGGPSCDFSGSDGVF